MVDDDDVDDAGDEENDEDWSWNAGPAIPYGKGRVLALLVADDREYWVSYVYDHAVITQEGKLLYEEESWLTDLWRSPTGRIYASAEGGAIHIFENGDWRVTQTSSRTMITCVWGIDDDHVWATSKGIILRQEGRDWIEVARGHGVYLDRIHGVSLDNLYAVGRRGLMLHWDGREWRRIEVPTNMHLLAVHALAADRVCAVGAEGVVLLGAGEEWEVIRLEEDIDFLDVVAFRGTIYLGGSNRGLFRLEDGEVVVVRDDIRASRLRADGAALCVAGDLSVHRFDGENWQSYTYS
ncbi:MAG TPA: hypothetical protein VH763_15185 [Gemmatimonadales bacterium]|jgi:hypothetical protein